MNDLWIKEHSPIAAEKLHAIGLIAFRWNSAELARRLLLSIVTNKNIEQSWVESGVRSSEIAKKIRNAVLRSANSDEVKRAVTDTLLLFDANQINRNQLIHFMPDGGEEEMGIRNSKNSSFSGIFDQPAVDASLENIRRVAEEIETLVKHTSDLCNWFVNRQYAGFLAPRKPLPETPPEPKRLWTPPQQ